VSERTKQKFLGVLNFTFMADYLGDKNVLTEKIEKKIKENPELIVEFIKGENGFSLELVPLHE
jgi:hypothetical protein|tara:strand:- start:598 stop:786 length:189 start_codon:yes stop_codon:yes gene_type:complete